MPGQWKKTDRLIGIMSDQRFVAFILYFNRDRDYYECHEVMEELWLEEGRSSLLQGLLQAAVGLHHWDNGNRSGAVMLMNAAQDKLQGYEDVVLGLDLVDLKKNLSESLKAIARSPDTAPFRSFKLIILDEALLQTVENAGDSPASPE
ncbi:DUF309 domain-containing protein [Cohnella lupini]|uniref:DUF309 domain-containing protein n=1 Tax=Cohnella lupini TaxID=1294267 RepID=A0A3D9I387_9BACL|nr:DUF309 domain-containing protein [Cohnella lupini]RED56238.1 hypothetical protein DFP95_11411 [Cohnella lupini]